MSWTLTSKLGHDVVLAVRRPSRSMFQSVSMLVCLLYGHISGDRLCNGNACCFISSSKNHIIQGQISLAHKHAVRHNCLCIIMKYLCICCNKMWPCCISEVHVLRQKHNIISAFHELDLEFWKWWDNTVTNTLKAPFQWLSPAVFTMLLKYSPQQVHIH